MTYAETVDYLFNQLPVFQVIGAGAYKPGLDTAYTLAAAFGNPHTSFKSVHVAGTNGKGSTSHMLASVFQEMGLKVGLYTSPHLFDFRERIRVNGEKIPEETVVDFMDRYLSMGLDCTPSFFELTTIMAFDYFRKSNVDIAVIEVGLGGRLDTTNIITPLLSLITNISLDHKAQLGDTVEKIAYEKAGIIKHEVPVVISEAEGGVREVFESVASSVGAPITFAQDNPYEFIESDSGKYIFSIKHGEAPSAECQLTGEFQTKNINGVITALNVLGIDDREAISRGLANVVENTGLMGRWSHIGTNPDVICDTGHNIGAWQYLAPKLQKIADSSTLRVVIGFVNDKDITPIFSLLPENAIYYFVTPSVKRGRPASDLLALAEARGLKASAFADVPSGYNKALADSSPTDTIFIGGSNFVVADTDIHEIRNME